MGYTKVEPSFRVDEKTPFYVVFGDHTRCFNVAKTDFCVMDNVKVLRPLGNYTLREVFFIVSSWKKRVIDKGYARHWSIAKEVNIQLPTKDGEIDFEYMEILISAIQKLVIKDVVIWADNKIEFTKQVTERS